MYACARFHEIPAKGLQDIKETKCYGQTDGRRPGRTDNMKTVFVFVFVFAGGGYNQKLKLEDHWSCSSPERLSHCKLMRFKLIENRPMKVYAWTLLTPGAWPNLTQGHDWHYL